MNLMQAVKNGFYTEVEACLKKGQPAKMMDVSGLSALHYAAKLGYADIIELLVHYGADLDQPATRFGFTPLHFAALFNQSEALEMLLTLGADIDKKDGQDNTALGLAILFNDQPDIFKFYSKEIPALELPSLWHHTRDSICTLLNQQADLPELEDIIPYVYDCLREDHVEGLKASVERGFDLNRLDSVQCILAGYRICGLIAASNFSVQCLAYLYEHNEQLFESFELSFSRILDNSFLIWVAQQMPSVDLLEAPHSFLKAQDEPHEKIDIPKYEPLILKNVFYKLKVDIEALKIYVSCIRDGFCELKFDNKGNLKDIQKLLDQAQKTLRFLIDKGEDLNHADKTKDTPSFYLASCPATLISVFIEAGMTFTGRDLQKAIETNYPDAVLLMLNHGAEVGFENGEGKNAIKVLMETENERMYDERSRLLEHMQICLDKEEQAKMDETIVDLGEDFEELSLMEKGFLPSFDRQRRLSKSQESSPKNSKNLRM